jgi:O-antigen ligase
VNRPTRNRPIRSPGLQQAPIAVLSVGMALAAGAGVPAEELLQDTFKSMVMGAAVLLASLVWCWGRVGQPAAAAPTQALRWHPLLMVPVGLAAYALGSMVWSHTYLAGVEAYRWALLGLLAWTVLNTAGPGTGRWLAWGIHSGAVMTAAWGALQFWWDVTWFPQGAAPASTFVNRNFAAEWVVSALPFGVWLWWMSRSAVSAAAIAITLALNGVFLAMTGTRAALAAGLLIALLLARATWRLRKALPVMLVVRTQGRWMGLVLAIAMGAGMGWVPTGNAQLRADHVAEQRGLTPFERLSQRARSVASPTEYTQNSFSVRLKLWKSTLNMMAAHPWTGVGAGAWEVNAPLFQDANAHLETDYYVHNEYLQLMAEYGLVGALALLAVSLWGLWALKAAWTAPPPERAGEHPQNGVGDRALVCAAGASLVALAIVSLAGFPWRLAMTGALLSVCLALVWRHGPGHSLTRVVHSQVHVRWLTRGALAGVCALAFVGLVAAVQAVRAEFHLVTAARLALTLSQTGDPLGARYTAQRQAMLEHVRQGTAIQAHYRKITPIVGDELARWGDWRNAVWIWESVLSSRPHVVALLANAARGNAMIDQDDKAWAYLARARRIAPEAASLTSLEVVLWMRRGDPERAMALAQTAVMNPHHPVDIDLLNAAFVLGRDHRNLPLAAMALQRRALVQPQLASDSWLRIGDLYSSATGPTSPQAMVAYRQAWTLADDAALPAVLARMPAAARRQISSSKE